MGTECHESGTTGLENGPDWGTSLGRMRRQPPVRLSVMEGYSRWAKTYDTTWNTLIAIEELYSLRLLDGVGGRYALDVGAGSGRFALKLAGQGWTVTALEPNPDMLAVAERAAAREALQVEFSPNRIEDGLPVESGTFDLVVCALTLCHVPDLRGAIGEFHRTLASGGHLLITDVHPDFVACGMPTHAGQPITKSDRLRKNMSRVMNAQEPELQDFGITSVGPAAQRARRLLNELHPGVRVHISHDLVGSPRLAELARRADVFVGAGAQQHTLRQR